MTESSEKSLLLYCLLSVAGFGVGLFIGIGFFLFLYVTWGYGNYDIVSVIQLASIFGTPIFGALVGAGIQYAR